MRFAQNALAERLRDVVLRGSASGCWAVPGGPWSLRAIMCPYMRPVAEVTPQGGPRRAGGREQPMPTLESRAAAAAPAGARRRAPLQHAVRWRLGCGQADRADALSADRARDPALDRRPSGRAQPRLSADPQGRIARCSAAAASAARPALPSLAMRWEGRIGAGAMRPRRCGRCWTMPGRSACAGSTPTASSTTRPRRGCSRRRASPISA